jgi:hypothetical protein
VDIMAFIRSFKKRKPLKMVRAVPLTAKGKGPTPIVVVRPGFMTTLARQRGFIQGDQKITDLPDPRMRTFALSLANTVGPVKALQMFQAQISFRAHAKGESLADRRKFETGKAAIQRQFFQQST